MIARAKQPRAAAPVPLKIVRCAIYTRKSTEDGLEQEFNSLDAQRESAEAYIASQRHEGWICLPDRYDDGGYSGGSMDRPALKQLMADVEAGDIDCIVVYKVDRLSRSLLDFARIIETLDRHSVSFVSVTQQFNTATSMGRLVLNVLLSFAQFEREIIGERTRDKMSAARKKGKWVGGNLALGYDVAPEGRRLVVNEDEAAKVRAIFDLYLERQSLIATVQELARRGWTNKQWVTRKGRQHGGRPFDKHSLYRVLSNIAYIGKVDYKGQVYDAEHPAIVGLEAWEQVQTLLRRNGRTGGAQVRNKYGALLKGLLRCVPCGCAMAHAYTPKRGKHYRYYVCVNAQKRGWDTCPKPSVPAGEIERFVVDQLRRVGKDHELIGETLAQARRQSTDGLEKLEAERRAIERELQRLNDDVRRLAGAAIPDDDPNSPAVARLADLQDRIRAAERRATEVRQQAIALSRAHVDEGELTAAVSRFEPVWDSLTPAEQARLVHLLVQQVAFDGRKGTLAVTFRPSGIKALACEPEGTRR
jgi:site-specific DNA recombinase